MCSPVDGRVLSCGRVGAFGRVEQIKGLDYGVRELLGASELEGLAVSAVDVVEGGDEEEKKEGLVVESVNKSLFYVTIYLGPGDYHGFHSPVDQWRIQSRRHIAGELLSVNPRFVSRVRELFLVNERVVLLGEWMYGFFSMTAVGATNVGNIVLEFDRELKTNNSRDTLDNVHERVFKKPVKVCDGFPTPALLTALVKTFQVHACFAQSFLTAFLAIPLYLYV